MRRYCGRVSQGATLLAALLGATASALAAGPNIVQIFADDLGWGSVGFNGQTKIATPNLDALAAGGMRLNNAYAAPVCAPSRAVLYTGFHQGHAVIDGNDSLSSGDAFRAEDVMIGQVLKTAGYSTSVFGKWGFGSTQGSTSTAPTIDSPTSLPNNHGYDEFYGYLNHGAAHDYYFKWMWQTSAGAPNGVATTINNGGPGGTPQYTHDLIAAKSEQYVTAHAGAAQPFYMQVNYTIPHVDLDDIASAPGGYGIYAGMPWTNTQKAYAAMITRMDASIGSLRATLDDPNHDGDHSDSVLSNTLILFTSDNGADRGTFATPTTDPADFFNANGGLRAGKFSVYEGGIREPAVAYWPGTIAPGTSTNYRTDVADIMATAADLAGAEAPVGIDGTSIAPTLKGETQQRSRKYLVWEHQGSRAVDFDTRPTRFAITRQDGIKLVRYGDETQALFNLTTDPNELSPLSMGIAANAQIAAELQAAAVAEGVLRGVVQYRSFTAASGSDMQEDSSWSGAGRPNGYWSATIINSSAAPRIAHVSGDVTTLGVEIRGQTALQVVDVHAGRTLTGRNEVRIGAHGRVDLSGGSLATSRWVNIRAGGELRGQGAIVGDIYNEGVVSPGRPDDSPAWPTAAPPALPSITLDTGVTAAVSFNFSGVQDDVPLSATSSLSPYAEVSKGLDFGPSIQPKLGNGTTDAGNEFNVLGFNSSSLTAAKDSGDYVSFTVDPIAGVGAIPSSVSFRVWRDVSTSANNYAILSSVDGFAAPTAQATYSDSGIAAQHTLTASLPTISAVADPIEYRLYAWGATNGGSNTHVNLASLNARFVAVPTLEFNFAGVQDGAPLTALKRTDANLALKAGLNFGPGVAPRGANNAGNEFHVAGFSTGGTLQSAIDSDDYLKFAVQPVAGMAMYPDSVSFTLWRQAAGSAADYAVFSSVGGFASGQQLAQAHHTTTGAGNQLTLTGSFAGAQPTTDAVEFRLYGWNAATSLDSTHVVGASMRARFASVVGSSIDPTGSLIVQGDFYHLDGGLIAIDLGGHAAGVDYDAVNVVGKVELEGDLAVSLADVGGSPFAPALGDDFDVLTATQGVIGRFAHVALPQLSAELDWNLDYLPGAVRLSVLSSADFNRDRTVDALDLSLWHAKDGQTTGAAKGDGDANDDGAVDGTDFLMWQQQLGSVAQIAESSHAVPEPAGTLMWATVASFLAMARRGTVAGHCAAGRRRQNF